MTTIITRAYADRAKADRAAKALRDAGYLDGMLDVVAKDGGDMVAALTAAKVDPGVASDYAQKLEEGQAVLVARVPFFPMGAAMNAMKIADRHKPLSVEVRKPTAHDRGRPKRDLSLRILRDTHFGFSSDLTPGYSDRIGHISPKFGWVKLLSDRKPPENALMEGHVSTRFLPWPLLSDRKPPENAVIRGHVSTKILPVPLLSHRSH